MTPRQFEELVCEHYRKQGYKTEITPLSGDYGIDVFATKGKEKLAIQAKMYGSSTRKINRQCVMELHGAKDYFDCTKAVIATDGVFLPDAIQVADKLNIDIIFLDSLTTAKPTIGKTNDSRKKAQKAQNLNQSFLRFLRLCVNFFTFAALVQLSIFNLNDAT